MLEDVEMDFERRLCRGKERTKGISHAPRSTLLSSPIKTSLTRKRDLRMRSNDGAQILLKRKLAKEAEEELGQL